MSRFSFPTNIKQIGAIDDSIKVYIEDYAYTYLEQYAISGNYNERLAFLIGKYASVDNQNVILISGVVHSKYTNHSDGIINITQETWNYVYDQMDIYFKGLEVVGLMQSQPGYGAHINEKYVVQFRNNFNKLYQTLLITDPTEKINVFHVFDNKREKLIATKGFFIYYEKNDNMNEYIIANKETKVVEEDICEEAPEVIIRKRQFERVQKSNVDQRKLVNMLASLSAILFLICFIMGTGLVQNEDRIAKLEYKLSAIDKNVKDEAEVFAPQPTLQIVKDVENSNNENATKESQKTNSLQKVAEHTEKTNPSQKVVEQSEKINPLQKVTEQSEKTNEPTKSSTPLSKVKHDTIPETYTVKDGDSLGFISMKFYGTTSMAEKIMQANRMDDANKIYSGKVLKLPNEQEE